MPSVYNEENYENVAFSELDLTEKNLCGTTFYNCSFTKSSFQYAHLVDCEFQNCTFRNCNLALVQLNNTKIIDTDFHDSKLLGINWGSVGIVIVASYTNCLLDNCAFSDMNLTKVKFNSCSLVEASFSHTKLARVKFDDCDLASCQFHQTDLTRADFSTSRNYYMNAETNKLSKTAFSLPEAVSLLANLDIELK